jgi:prevent-host-death family protein
MRGDIMSTINITNARQNLFQLVSDVNIGFNPITIVNNKGKNAVLISEDEWKNIEETLNLSSIPGLVDDVTNIKNTENWKNAKEYDPNEDW